MTGETPAAMPERIGRYELLFPIGTGGMGAVYLGRAEVVPGVMRNVAVKLMHSELRANPEIAPQLLDEAKIAAGIHHPNVVAVLEAGESPHGVYLVMDHVEGATLSGLIRAARKREEQIPIRVAAKILRDALTGLHAAHDAKDENGQPLELVHRDFSPHNILVGTDGNSLLTDFGIAKALSHISTTATGIVKGKVGYMAPEQARGERVDRRSDVWAAGVVAWELFTTQRLFRASNDAATLLEIVSGKRPPLVSSIRSDIPDRVDEAVAAALEPKPSRRLATAQALKQRIEDALVDHGGLAGDDDVAEYVRDLVGDELAKNRARAAEVLARRAELRDSGSRVTPPPSDVDDVSHTRAALATVSAARPRPRSRYFAAGAVLVALAAGAAFYANIRASEPAPVTGPLPFASARAALHIVANAPIAQLQIDSRTIVVPQATRALEVPLRGDAPERLVAITEDGRKLELTLDATSRDLRLEFPDVVAPAKPSAEPAPRPTPAAARPFVAPRASARRWVPPPPAAPPPGDGLADSPYGAQ